MEAADDRLLVDAKWLAGHMDDPGIALIDTRPADEYWSGHLARARHFDPVPFLYHDTGATGLSEFTAQIEWIFSSLGLDSAEPVVVYETDCGARAARVLWLLHYCGRQTARMLDGGLKGLTPSGTQPAPILPRRFRARWRTELLATWEYIRDHLGDAECQLLDVRSEGEYYGETLHTRRAGAIPGALLREWTSNLSPQGSLKSAEELSSAFHRLGLRPDREIIVYGQDGHDAAHSWIALTRAGFPRVRTYLASWSEWGNRDDLPIECPRRRRTVG